MREQQNQKVIRQYGQLVRDVVNGLNKQEQMIYYSNRQPNIQNTKQQQREEIME